MLPKVFNRPPGALYMKSYSFQKNLLIALVLSRIILVWYGFDRLPFLSSNDEVLYNDAAVAMSKGFGLVAKSLAGTMDLGKIYGHHPPLFPLIQSVIFRLFGFSAFTLRALGIACFILYSILFIVLLYRLKNIGIYDDFSFFSTDLLFISDPTSFDYARWGRPDSLALFFGIVAFRFIISVKGINNFKKCG
jgi:4-amino-4-deoxy-L-arabinose transferase-like glycosyltransferase